MDLKDRSVHKVSRSMLCSVVEARMEEIFGLARQEIRKSTLGGFMTTGVVITGGASLINGSVELAEPRWRLRCWTTSSSARCDRS